MIDDSNSAWERILVCDKCLAPHTHGDNALCRPPRGLSWYELFLQLTMPLTLHYPGPHFSYNSNCHALRSVRIVFFSVPPPGGFAAIRGRGAFWTQNHHLVELL